MTQLLQASPWELEAYQRVLALKDLPDDWDRPPSKKPAIAAINAALDVIWRAAQLEIFVLGSPFIAPMSNGGVQLEWDHGQRQLEIELLPDGRASFIISDAGEITEGEFTSPFSPDVSPLLGWLAASP